MPVPFCNKHDLQGHFAGVSPIETNLTSRSDTIDGSQPAFLHAGLQSLLQQSPKLKHLDLNGCINVDRIDLGIQPSLRHLEVTGCRTLQEVSCSAEMLDVFLAAGCQKIQVSLVGTATALHFVFSSLC